VIAEPETYGTMLMFLYNTNGISHKSVATTNTTCIKFEYRRSESLGRQRQSNLVVIIHSFLSLGKMVATVQLCTKIVKHVLV